MPTTVTELAQAMHGQLTCYYRTPNGDRYENEYYLLPGRLPLSSGHLPAAEFTVTHDRERKEYRAELSLGYIVRKGSMISTRHGWTDEHVRTTLATMPVKRYTAASFSGFLAAARGTVAQLAAV